MRFPSPYRRQAKFWLAAVSALVVASGLASGIAGGVPPPQGQQEFSTQVSAERGKLLFTGQIPFQNGGPPCSACHSISSLSFPNGGTLGPNLTGAYVKLGPEGMDAALETLYFPAMAPLYDPHPLTIPEQANLKEFLKQASSQPPAPDITVLVAVIALLGFIVLVLITWFVWRNRSTGVRRALLERALRSGGNPS